MDDDFVVFVRGDLVDAGLDGAYRDQWGAEVRDGVLVGLADVEDEDVFFGVEFLFELLDGDLWDAFDDGGFGYGLVAGDFERTDGIGWGDAAELVVVDQLGDGGVGAADGAVGVLSQLEGAEGHAEGVYEQEAADEGVADAEDELDGLGGLDDADKAGEDAEDSAFGAGGNEARRWRLRVEAAVAGALLGAEDAGLALEAEDAAVGVGLAGEDAGVVDEVAGLEVVGAVGDDVVVLEDFKGVGGGEHGVVLDDVEEGVEALEHDLRGVDLELADGGGGVDDLALEVGGVDGIEVDEADGAYSGSGEIEGERGSEASGADAEDLGGLELLLAFHANLGQDEVTGIAGDLLVGELGELDGFFYGCWHAVSLV